MHCSKLADDAYDRRMEELPPRVLAVLAVAGAIATFATSAGDAFPNWVPRVSLAVALLFAALAGALFFVSTYPHRVKRWWPKGLTARPTAMPLATHRRQLLAGKKVPVIRDDFKIVWQDWCDDMTALLRGRGVPYDRPYADDADEHAVLREYFRSGLRNRALRHADEATDQGLVDRLYREKFYAPTSAIELWQLTRNVGGIFIERNSSPRPRQGPPVPPRNEDA